MLKLKNKFIIFAMALLWVATTAIRLSAEPKLFDPSAYKKGGGEEKINLDFNNQEIVDVAKQIAVLIDKNIIIDPSISGKITLISPKKVTIAEAYNAFLAAINMQGITVIDSGKFLKIVKVDSIKQNSAIDLGETTISQDESYVTKMINVKFIDASQLKNAIASMVSKGNIEVYEPTNTLIITDTIKNIERIKKVIESLDVEGFEERVEFIPLRYAPAKVMAEKLSTLLNVGKGGAGQSRYGGGSSYSSGSYSTKASSSSTYAEDRKKNISSIIADERTNSIIVKATEKGIIEVQELVKKLDTDLTNDHNAIRPYFYRLEHTEAVKVSEVLNSILNDARAASKSKYGSGSAAGASTSSYSTASYRPAYSYGGEGDNTKIGGEEIKVTADEATNSLIIIATKSGYESIVPIIQELDRQRKQVNIAATIMEVYISNVLKLGTSLHGGGAKGDTGYFGGTNNFGGLHSTTMSDNPSAMAGLTGLLLGTSTGVVDLGKGISMPAIGAVLNASANVQDFKVIQNPNITTLDNNEAVIKIGQKIYVPTESITDTNNPTASKTNWTSQDVVLQLTIKPKVNHSNEVTMEIDQVIDDLATMAEEEKNKPPSIKTRNAKTIAMSKSGETIAIGGIISDETRTTVNKVPVLGDIPVLGWLFKSKNDEKVKKNLIIFITPTVLESSRDIVDLNNMTLERRQKFYKELGIEVDNWVVEDPKKRHSAGISIQYSNAKGGKPKAGKTAESYFADSKEGVTNLEAEGTSGKIR